MKMTTKMSRVVAVVAGALTCTLGVAACGSSSNVDAGAAAAEQVATTYERSVQSDDPETACGLAARPDVCRAGFGSRRWGGNHVTSVEATASEPVTTAPNAAGRSTTGIGVMVSVETQEHGASRSAVLVDEQGKVVRRVPVTQESASSGLPDLLGEQVQP